MRVRLRVLVPGTRVRIRHPGQGSAAPGWSMAASLAPAVMIPPTTYTTPAAAGPACCVAPGCA
jgi:hypothetical protein